jgi:hypothetical protein
MILDALISSPRIYHSDEKKQKRANWKAHHVETILRYTTRDVVLEFKWILKNESGNITNALQMLNGPRCKTYWAPAHRYSC